MSYRLLFVLNAVVVLVLGAALVLTPELMLNQVGAETRIPELHMARFFGTALVTLGLLLWFAKDASEEQIQKKHGHGHADRHRPRAGGDNRWGCREWHYPFERMAGNRD